MWLKPPVWEEHYCEKPKLTSTHMPDSHFDCYVDAIWRCDFCLKTYIVKEIDKDVSRGRRILTWRSYQIGS